MIKINLLGRVRPQKKRDWGAEQRRSVLQASPPPRRDATPPADAHASTSVADRRPSLRMLADIALSDDVGDRLGFKPFADAIAGVIDSPRTATPLVLAVNAKWGAGKTTLGQMIKRRLEEKPAAEGYSPHVTCWFNAWMHDDAPSLSTSLAAEIAQAANRSRSVWRRLISPLPASLTGARWRRVRRGLYYFALLVLLLFVCGTVSVRLGYSPGDIVKLDPRVIKSLVSLPGNAYVVTFVVALVIVFKAVTAFLPVAKSVGEFVRDPGQAAKSASMNEVRRQLGTLISQATPKRSKFIIFIDDLDRCQPPRPVDVLEVVNQLLDHPGVVVVLMADMQVVATCARIKYSSLEGKASEDSPFQSPAYGWNYLQKIVQLQFDLPVYPARSIRRMLEVLTQEVPEQGRGSRVPLIARYLGSKLRNAWEIVLSSTRSPIKFSLMVFGFCLGVGYPTLHFLPRKTGSVKFIAYIILIVIGFQLTLTIIFMVLVIVRRVLTARRRRQIDAQIQARIAAGEREFSKVETAVRRTSWRWGETPETENLVRERLQHYLEDESELQREAEDEVMRYLDPVPRHAKRLINRLRLLLFVAHERKMFGGRPALSPRHIGNWAVLCERWPELAQAVCKDPEIMIKLENSKQHSLVLKKEASIYKNDAALRDFCLHSGEIKLSPVMVRLVQFAPASGSSL